MEDKKTEQLAMPTQCRASEITDAEFDVLYTTLTEEDKKKLIRENVMVGIVDWKS